MAAVTGKAGAVTLAGSAASLRIQSWALSQEIRTVEDTAAGDTLVGRLALFLDYTIEIEGAAHDQANWDQHAGLIGTNVAFTLKRKSGDTNPYASGTAMVTRHSTTAPHDDRIMTSLTLQCSGTALTLDTTPES